MFGHSCIDFMTAVLSSKRHFHLHTDSRFQHPRVRSSKLQKLRERATEKEKLTVIPGANSKIFVWNSCLEKQNSYALVTNNTWSSFSV